MSHSSLGGVLEIGNRNIEDTSELLVGHGEDMDGMWWPLEVALSSLHGLFYSLDRGPCCWPITPGCIPCI